MMKLDVIDFAQLILELEISKNLERLSINMKYEIFDESLEQIEFYTNHYLKIDLPRDIKTASVKRQVEFLAGRVCAINAMQSYGLLNQSQLGRNQNGTPNWPQNIIGSISHSKNIASAIIANSRIYSGMGFDIERVKTNKFIDLVIAHVICDKELECFYSLNLSKAEIFAIAFSGKEALFKAIFPQVNKKFYFKDVQYIYVSPTKNKWAIALSICLSSAHYKGKIYDGSFYLGYKHVLSLVLF